MDLIAVIISGLAGWRLANLAIAEDGPWFIFEKFRKFIGIKPGPVTGFLPTLFSCIYCISIWCSLGAYLIYIIFPQAVIIIAAASIVIIVDKLARS